MTQIESFKIDHTRLERGVYVRSVDCLGTDFVTTFDLRMKAPYKEARLKAPAVHAIEHALATYLRNRRSDVVYVGPMGCMTGFYVLLSGKKQVSDLLFHLIDAFEWLQTLKQVPGATRQECGNFTFMDLEGAKREAEEYLKTLTQLWEEQ